MASSERKRLSVVINSPVVISFAAICAIALGINALTGGLSNSLIFSVYRSSMTDPLTYVRFFGHVIGHGSVSHLINNMMFILVIGPMLEEKYSSKNIVMVILFTAIVTGLVHFIAFPGIMLMGASGVVFAFILLASMTGFKNNEIPLTFILVAILYLGQQIYEGLFVADDVSQLTHILGGCVGALVGFKMNGRKR